MTDQEHVIDALPITLGPYTQGWFGACTPLLGGCGWTGPERAKDERGKALWDAREHGREMKEAAA